MTTQDQTSGPHFLADAPAEADEFGGGHDRVAQALANLIVHKKGGRGIALRGPYGSGKTSVIKFMEQKLKHKYDRVGNKLDARVFTYDAWEHQGDPLRRSFLEDFIEFIEDDNYNWAKDNEWKKEKEKLSQRTETIDTTIEPRLTWPGRFVAASLLLVPLGYILFRQVGQSDNISILGVPIWIIGLFLAILPIVISIFTYICWRPWKATHRRLIQKKLGLESWKYIYFFWYHRPPNEGSSVFNLFVREKHKDVKTSKIKTVDPTSLEFQNIFHNVLEKTLKGSSRKVIIVVDNLDRLPARRALSAWATMRTFFEKDDHVVGEWFDRFWLIVPFDFEALEEIWSKASASGTEDSTDGEVTVDGHPTSNEGLRAFIDKTFEITFRVAPPVDSDWKSFFIDRLQDAFPDIASKEETGFHTVYRLYQLESGVDSGSPTPRDIKIFINHLVAYYQQWKDENWGEEGERVALPLIALYELKRDELSGAPEKLTESDFLSVDVLGLVQKWEWRRHLAALHFNVKPEAALQVLIGENVEKALAEGDADSLRDWMDVEGFYPVLLRSVKKLAGERQPEIVAATARTLDECEVGRNPSVSETWHHLRVAVRLMGNWVPYSENIGRGVVAILEHTPEGEYDEICSRACHSFTEVNDDVDPDDWVDAAIPVVRAIKSRNGQTLDDEFQVPGNADFFVNALTHLVREHVAPTEEIIRYFAPSVKPSNIIDTFDASCSDGEFTSIHPDVIWALKRVRENGQSTSWEWKPLLDTLSRRIRWDFNVTGSEELYSNLMSLIVLAEHHDVERAGALLSNNNGIDSCFHHLYETQDDPRLSATCVLALLIYNPKGQSGGGNGRANDGRTFFNGDVLENYRKNKDLVYRVAQITTNYNLLGRMLESTQVVSQKTQGFVQCLAGYIVEESEESQEDRFAHVNAQILCDYADRIVPGIQNTLSDLVYYLHREGSLIEQLRTYSKSEWFEVLEVDGDRLDIIISLVTQGIDPDLPSAFIDALRKHTQALVDKEDVEVHRPQKEWIRLLEAVSEDSKATFLRDVRDKMLELDQPVGRVMNLYGDVLLDEGILAEEADQVVRRLFRPIIVRGDTNELKELESIVEGGEILQSAQEESRTRFESRIREKYQESSIEVKERLEEIAEKLSVTLPEKLEEETDSEADSSEEE